MKNIPKKESDNELMMAALFSAFMIVVIASLMAFVYALVMKIYF